MLITALFAFTLVACDYSSDTGTPAANVASVNAGIDASVNEGQAISLSAAVYPEGGVVNWTQTRGPQIEGFPFLETNDVAVTSPSVAVDTELEFKAEYIAPDGQIVYDSIVVMVVDMNSPPIPIITLENQTTPPFSVYDIIKLNADASYDSDGEIRLYKWTQIDDNPALEFLTDDVSSSLQIKGPLVTEITNYKIQLEVTDNYGAKAENIIDIQVAPALSDIAANAGDDSVVVEFTSVSLNGTDSISSVSDVTCRWIQLAGYDVILDDDTACLATFTAPDVDAEHTLIFEIIVTDTANNVETAQVTVTVLPSQLGLLHDTGITECYGNFGVIECGDERYPNQDAESGRDPIADRLDKSGQGKRGFDFTKFDANGDELANDSLVFSCIRDNMTGLIWEVKQAPTNPRFGSLRGAENYYSYDESAPGTDSCPNAEGCGVDSYVEQVNELAFCGGANWRIPTFMELMSIMDYNDLDDEYLFDEDFFPFYPDKAELGHMFYWVMEANAEGGAESFQWVLDLSTGDDSAILKSSLAYVILVRTP
jgi:hypothetical protein